MRRFNLTNYQLDAFKEIIHEYQCGGNSALVLMPPGSGKTVLATTVLRYLADKYEVKNIAHVSMLNALSTHVNQVFENEPLPKEHTIVTYTYAELSDAIANDSISKEYFDIIVFDGLDEFESTKPDLKLYSSPLNYFNCFKIAFGRGVHSDVRKGFKLVYRYSYEQSIQDGSFVHIQKSLYP
ncbi:DEAD/DEAH box helicase family protein [Vibrio campbellii]|uniref:DEAD/DEAH box helicase family protein n=1 Tax=Vibrio campbellii TaxID=680 RepID=UPI001F2E7B46|nr:DEAD/DEAH box helicase family protein [Vibrio campbellii]MCE7733134.1 DEAD/DEAH box helicase family protein [Vibrio campbellii]